MTGSTRNSTVNDHQTYATNSQSMIMDKSDPGAGKTGDSRVFLLPRSCYDRRLRSRFESNKHKIVELVHRYPPLCRPRIEQLLLGSAKTAACVSKKHVGFRFSHVQPAVF